MSDEHIKLIAKIQHFYDFMNRRLVEFEDRGIVEYTEFDRVGYREKTIELNSLLTQYAKVFQEFLYKEKDSD